MSASNWAHCPRCSRAAFEALEARGAAVQASYGTVPVEEFDEARRQQQEAVKAFNNRQETFREEYEIYGADEGVVKVEYSGSCEQCGLSLSFTDERPIPGSESNRD